MDDPIGYSSTIFSIKAGNTAYTIDDFATFNGIRVGMIEDADALTAALQDGSINAIVTSSLRAATVAGTIVRKILIPKNKIQKEETSAS